MKRWLFLLHTFMCVWLEALHSLQEHTMLVVVSRSVPKYRNISSQNKNTISLTPLSLWLSLNKFLSTLVCLPSLIMAETTQGLWGGWAWSGMRGGLTGWAAGQQVPHCVRRAERWRGSLGKVTAAQLSRSRQREFRSCNSELFRSTIPSLFSFGFVVAQDSHPYMLV